MEGPSFWSLKPWWCQPWSIVLTGVIAVGGSWWALRLWWITLPVAAVVMGWWILFLVLVPAGTNPTAMEEGNDHGDPPD